MSEYSSLKTKIIRIERDEKYVKFIDDADNVAGEIYEEFYGIYPNELVEFRSSCISLLKQDNKPISVCFLCFHDEEKLIDLSHFGTTPEYQGLGYGKKLLNSIKKYAIENGYEKIRLDCSKDVCGVYEKCGFVMDKLKSTEWTIYFDWDTTMLDNIIENTDPLCEIIFEKNRTETKSFKEKKIIHNIRMNMPYTRNIHHISSGYNLDGCYDNYDVGNVFIIITDEFDIPVCACYLHQENKDIKTLRIDNIHTKNEDYEIYLIEQIKKYINENNYESFMIETTNLEGIVFYEKCGMIKNSDISIIYNKTFLY